MNVNEWQISWEFCAPCPFFTRFTTHLSFLESPSLVSISLNLRQIKVCGVELPLCCGKTKITFPPNHLTPPPATPDVYHFLNLVQNLRSDVTELSLLQVFVCVCMGVMPSLIIFPPPHSSEFCISCNKIFNCPLCPPLPLPWLSIPLWEEPCFVKIYSVSCALSRRMRTSHVRLYFYPSPFHYPSCFMYVR